MLKLITVVLAATVAGRHLPSEAQTRTGGLTSSAAALTGASAPATPDRAWAIYDAAPELAADALLAARAGPKLLNPPINVTPKGLEHVIERHTHSGIAKYAGKSKFNAGEDVVDLIRSGTQQPMVQQANGNFARTFDMGRSIGVDRTTNQATSVMTVITKPDGTLVTAFPGTP